MAKLILAKDKRFLVHDITKPYHFLYGTLTPEQLQQPSGTLLTTNTGVKVKLLAVSLIDLYRKLKKKAQTIPLKDLSYILSYTGIGKNSIVVEAGTGSGASAAFFALHTKKVYTFDIREDHQAIALKNFEQLGLSNITAKIHDVYQGFPLKSNVDLVLLDLAEPWKAIDHAEKILHLNGWLVSYSPTIPQVSDFVEAVKKHMHLLYESTVKVTVEEWEVKGRVIRPSTYVKVGHSGFLSFVRKIQE